MRNQFTKDELICIRDNLIVPETYNDRQILLMAYHKLLGMIENYCEHDFPGGSGGSYTESFHESFNCKKCGKNYYD